jgi:hypothetical protein
MYSGERGTTVYDFELMHNLSASIDEDAKA